MEFGRPGLGGSILERQARIDVLQSITRVGVRRSGHTHVSHSAYRSQSAFCRWVHASALRIALLQSITKGWCEEMLSHACVA